MFRCQETWQADRYHRDLKVSRNQPDEQLAALWPVPLRPWSSAPVTLHAPVPASNRAVAAAARNGIPKGKDMRMLVASREEEERLQPHLMSRA